MSRFQARGQSPREVAARSDSLPKSCPATKERRPPSALARSQPCATTASLLGLWSGAADPSQARRLAAHVEEWARGLRLVPSTDPMAASFDPRGFWRGSVWINVNWMIAEGLREHGQHALADRIAADSRALLQGAGLREHFDARTGEGLGAADFSWTAALARWWLEME